MSLGVSLICMFNLTPIALCFRTLCLLLQYLYYQLHIALVTSKLLTKKKPRDMHLSWHARISQHTKEHLAGIDLPFLQWQILQ